MLCLSFHVLYMNQQLVWILTFCLRHVALALVFEHKYMYVAIKFIFQTPFTGIYFFK